MDKPLFNQYTSLTFKPVRCYGYCSGNKETDPEAKRKKAKTPIDKGFNTVSITPLTISEALEWESQGGWIGWLLPKGVVAIDAEEENTIGEIKRICNSHDITPPEDKTLKGIHVLFEDPHGITGASEKVTKAGFIVTYRAGGSNILILPDTEGRIWTVPLNGGFPRIPEELTPRDEKDVNDVLNALSWNVGEVLRFGMVAGYEDIDLGYMAYLDYHGMSEEQIHRALEKVFLSEYNFKRTQDMIERLRNLKESRKPFIGSGSFVKAIQDKNLLNIRGYMSTFERLTGGTCQAESEWLDPIPFDECSLLPDFPIEALPEKAQGFIRTVAECIQVDAALPGLSYIAVLSACFRNQANIDLVTHQEPANIYALIVDESGTRKSSTLNTITRPLYEYQAELKKNIVASIAKAESEHKVLEQRIIKKQKLAAGTENAVERQQLINEIALLTEELANNPVPAFPTLIADDVTTEKAAMLTAENDECLAIISTEGGIFETLAGRYSNEVVNFDFYLKAHPGDPCRVHRVGRPPIELNNPYLTMCLTVQPDVIASMAKHTSFRGRGLTARFIYARAKTHVGYRGRKTKGLDVSTINGYRDGIFELLKIPKDQTIRTLKLSPEAQAKWDEFYTETETSMRPNGELELLHDWGSKLSGQVARIAGLFHFARYGEECFSRDIGIREVISACGIGKYLKDHALATFSMMKEDQRIKAAKKILEFITQYRIKTFKCREVMQKRNMFHTMDDILPGIKILLERDFIRTKRKEHDKIGRPEAMEYIVNPKLKMDI